MWNLKSRSLHPGNWACQVLRRSQQLLQRPMHRYAPVQRVRGGCRHMPSLAPQASHDFMWRVSATLCLSATSSCLGVSAFPSLTHASLSVTSRSLFHTHSLSQSLSLSHSVSHILSLSHTHTRPHPQMMMILFFRLLEVKDWIVIRVPDPMSDECPRHG